MQSETYKGMVRARYGEMSKTWPRGADRDNTTILISAMASCTASGKGSSAHTPSRTQISDHHRKVGSGIPAPYGPLEAIRPQLSATILQLSTLADRRRHGRARTVPSKVKITAYTLRKPRPCSNSNMQFSRSRYKCVRHSGRLHVHVS
jgi:hypothetical protein